MVCEHLKPLEEAMIAAGIRETYRGSPWSKNCRGWVYFECILDCTELESVFDLPDCVVEHRHCGEHVCHRLGDRLPAPRPMKNVRSRVDHFGGGRVRSGGSHR